MPGISVGTEKTNTNTAISFTRPRSRVTRACMSDRSAQCVPRTLEMDRWTQQAEPKSSNVHLLHTRKVYKFLHGVELFQTFSNHLMPQNLRARGSSQYLKL